MEVLGIVGIQGTSSFRRIEEDVEITRIKRIF
jgi:hypothetical protein